MTALSITSAGIEKTVKTLCNDIGLRLAGSDGERKAADYIAGEFRKYSSHVTIEEFPVFERCVTSEKLEVMLNGQWQEFPCSLFSSAVSTGGKVVEADLVMFDTETGYQRESLEFLRGKGVIHLGCHIESEDAYRRLMEAKPAFILFVDVRYTGVVQLADGLFPAYVKKYGSVPSLNVAYMDAWKWLQNKAAKARICVSGESKPAKTTVVICELPGTDPDAGIIYAGGHHDTQAGTVGADDNAVGSAAVIELARILSQTPHKRTFRLCSFGAEEQLSVGSSAYARAHRAEIEQKGVFMCNFDSFGSALGWNEFLVNGTDALRGLVRETFRADDVYYVEVTSTCPYTDQFPFAACKVPGIWISRKNCAAGLFYHHRVDNTPDIIGFDVCAQTVEAASKLMAKIADSADVAAIRGIPADLQKQIDKEFAAVYGGF